MQQWTSRNDLGRNCLEESYSYWIRCYPSRTQQRAKTTYAMDGIGSFQNTGDRIGLVCCIWSRAGSSKGLERCRTGKREKCCRKSCQMPWWQQTSPPQPGYRCGYSVVGGLLVDECDGLVLQRGFEMWCNAVHQPGVEGGQHARTDRNQAQDGLGDPRY